MSELVNNLIGYPIETIEGSLIVSTDMTAELNRLSNINPNRQDPIQQDIDVFFKLFKTVIETKLRYEGNENQVLVARQYPDKEQLEKWHELIVYRLMNRTPARTDVGSPRESGKRIPLSSTLRVHGLPDPDYPGYLIDIYEQRYENDIELTCWSRNGEEADFRARWLEDTMLDFSWFFAANGISEIAYLGRSMDKESLVQPGELKFSGCPLNYWIRTTKTYISHLKTISEIRTVLQVSGEISSD